MKVYVISAFAAILFIGCSASTTLINPKYKNKSYSKKQILVMPFSNDVISVMNKDDVADDFEEDKRDPETVIKDKVVEGLTENIDRYVWGIDLYRREIDPYLYQSQLDSTKYFMLQKRLGGKNILYKFYVPKKEVLESYNIKPDVILVINNITFARNQTIGVPLYVPGNTVSTPGGSFTTAGHMSGGGKTEFLGAAADFIIYDYNEDDFINCGSAVVQSNFVFAMTTSTWEDAFFQITTEIFKDTPFKLTLPVGNQ